MSTLENWFHLKDDPFIRQMETFGTIDTRPVRCRCKCCDADLCDGDRYWDVNGEVVCADCIESMSAGELLEMLQIENQDVVEMCGGSEKTVGEAE